MPDVVDKETRSRMMSGIRGKNTKPEIIVRKALFAAGYRFRLHRRDLPGVPDIVLSGRRIAVFVHGCFWHLHPGCANARVPSTRAEFWREKLGLNVERDRVATDALIKAGWRVLTVWECATRNLVGRQALTELLAAWIEGVEVRGELAAPVQLA